MFKEIRVSDQVLTPDRSGISTTMEMYVNLALFIRLEADFRIENVAIFVESIVLEYASFKNVRRIRINKLPLSVLFENTALAPVFGFGCKGGFWV